MCLLWFHTKIWIFNVFVMFSYGRLDFPMFWLCFNEIQLEFPCFFALFSYNPSHSPWLAGPVCWLDGWVGWLWWLVDRLAGWLRGLAGWLAGKLDGWLARCLVGWPVAPNNWIIRIPIWKLYLTEINYNNLNFHVFCCVFCVPHRDSPNCSKELDNWNSHRMIKFDLKRWDNWKFHFLCVAFVLFYGPRDLCHTDSLTLFF